jgi:hypothetical protein
MPTVPLISELFINGSAPPKFHLSFRFYLHDLVQI